MAGIGDNNRYVEGDLVELAPSAARTAAGQGLPLLVGRAHTLRASLSVTAASGTSPSLTVTLQTSADGTTWRTALAFAAATGVSSQRISTSGLDAFVRASWTVSGTTPSFTFAVTGELV